MQQPASILTRDRVSREMYEAVRSGDDRLLQACCDYMADPANRANPARAYTDALGVTPLILAVRKRLTTFIRKLLAECKVDVLYNNPVASSTGDQNMGTALHEAAAIRDSEAIVSLLLEHNADPWQANMSGLTAFDCAQNAKSESVMALLKQYAVYIGSVKAKCCMHYYDSIVGIYKTCDVVVTPYIPYLTAPGQAPIKKRVYIFKGSSCKPKAVLTYEAADIIMDSTGERAHLRMHDTDGSAVQQVNDTFRHNFQNGYRKATTVGLALAPIGCTLVLANIIGTASPIYFSLMTPGRKEYSLNPTRGAPPEHTSVFFRPDTSMQEFEQFVEALEGPRNQALYLAALNASVLEEELSGWSSTGILNAIPRPPPPDLERIVREPVCVVCYSEPVTRGFLHGKTMHAVCCRNCVRVALPGMPCPMCRTPVESLVAL